MAADAGFEPWMAVGRVRSGSASKLIRIGNRLDFALHVGATRLLDRHGLHSRRATEAFIRRAESLNPDIIHLHNIHGYYLHYPTLFQWLRTAGNPIVWTLHDCWPITGHCAFFSEADCWRWRSTCGNCPLRRSYPASWMADRSAASLNDRQKAFSGIPNLTIVAVSHWLDSIVAESYLSQYPRVVIPNGIDTTVFRPSAPKSSRQLILGVASRWDSRKGLDHFVALRRLLPPEWHIRLIGLTPAAIRRLPEGIEGLPPIADPETLAAHYSRATVFVCPTRGEANNMTKMEALACGTPVVTYDSGGAAEGISPATGAVVSTPSPEALAQAILNLPPIDSKTCRETAVRTFSASRNLGSYFSLYRSMLDT